MHRPASSCLTGSLPPAEVDLFVKVKRNARPGGRALSFSGWSSVTPRLKSDAARILATDAEFETPRASPLRRKPAMALLNSGAAIAPITPMMPTTTMISSMENP